MLVMTDRLQSDEGPIEPRALEAEAEFKIRLWACGRKMRQGVEG